MTMASSASERAYSLIREAILCGIYAPGSALREEELAAEIGVSRTPIREALRRLDAEGFTDSYHNRGASVAFWSEQELDEIFNLRVQLEGYGARLAARTIESEQLEILGALADRMEAAAARQARDLVEQITQWNNEFHRCILDAGGNRRLSALLAAIVQPALVRHTFHLYAHEELMRSLTHHRDILAALTQHDPDWAEAAMRSHLLAGRGALRSEMATEQGRPAELDGRYVEEVIAND